jgi:hypothetical protein
MRIPVLTALLTAGVLSAVGCNPIGPKPMVDRLSDDDQRAVTESWNKALQPVDKLDRQAFLDILVYGQAYQVGVDRLNLRSEKTFSGGVVVMEVHFDRARPAEDRFEVTIRDQAGKELRRVVYSRQEVELTFKDLYDQNLAGNPGLNQPPLPADQARKREEVQRRLKAIEALFPKREEPKDAAKK